MSQSDVAQGAGLTQGHYSRIENGLTTDGPTIENVERIASALSFPIDFFYQQDGLAGLPLSVHPMNRKKASVSEGALRQVHAELNIRLMHLRRYLRAVDITPELPRPHIDPYEGGGPQEIARIIRRSWMMPDGPVKNLTDWCERSGIVVVWCEFDAPIDGVAMTVRDLPPCIFLNSKVPADRMRFSLGHELAHVIMHKVPTESIEDEANLFAAEFLVPERAFTRLLIGQKLSLDWLARQKAYWGVSMAFLLYRVGQLGLATRHQTEYLWKKISVIGWRLREPQETDIDYEVPTVFPGLIRFHSENLQYGLDDLRRLLNADPREVRKLYGAHMGKHRLQVIK